MKPLRCKLGLHKYGPWSGTILTSSYDCGESKFNIRYCVHCNYDHRQWRREWGGTYSEYGIDAKQKTWRETE